MQRELTAVILASLLCTGCTAWHQKPVEQRPDVVYFADPARVQLRDGRTLLLTDVRVAGDTLSGVPIVASADAAHAVVRIPTRDVVSLQVREASPQRSVALTGGVMYVGAFVLGYLMLGGGG